MSHEIQEIRTMRQFINEILEEEYMRSKSIGQDLRTVFSSKKTQMRNLENMIHNTQRFSEILSFIENQVGKANPNKEWRANMPNSDFKAGEVLLDELNRLAEKIDNAKILQSSSLKYQAKIELARGWVDQVVSSYLYATAQNEDHR